LLIIKVSNGNDSKMRIRAKAIKVKVEFLGYLSQMVKKSKDGYRVSENLEDAIRQIYKIVGLDKQSQLNHIVLINGINYALFLKSEAKLQEGDTLSFVPIVSGG